MSIAQMREEVKKLYPGEAWKKKVDAMTDYQILAIYRRKVLKE